MNDYPASSHERVITRDGRSGTSWQNANLVPDASIARRLHSGPTAA
jgi:hypothetical protein